MTAFRNFSDPCCPRLPKSYREIERRIERQNYGVDSGKYIWNGASSKSTAHPYIYKEKEINEKAYVISWESRKRKIRTPERCPTNSTLNQPKRLRKDQSSLCEKISRLQGGSSLAAQISRAPLSQRSSLNTGKRPTWREDHEKKLREEAEAQEEKDKAIMLQNQIKKREARVKFQQILDINRHQAVRNPGSNPYGDHLGQEKSDLYDENRPSQSPEEIERILLKLFPKVGRHGKNKKQLNEVPSSEITPFERKKKIQKAKDVRMIRKFLLGLNLPTKKNKGIAGKYATPGSLRSLHKSYQHILDSAFPWIGKPPPHTDTFDQMLQGKAEKVPELHPLLKSKHLMETSNKKTTKVGAKFSWNFRNKLKAKAQPKMSKPFDELLKGREVEIPELKNALRSQHKIKKRKAKKNEKNKEKMAGKSTSEPEPNYGLYTTKTHKPRPGDNKKPPISQQFHKMLKGKEARMPELKKALMSHHKIRRKSSTESDDLYEFTTPPKDKDHLPSFTDKQIEFDEVLLLSPKRSRRFSLPGQKLHLKRFYHYIKDSTPDRRIMEQVGSKRSIAYLRRNSISSQGSEKSGRDRPSVEMPENSSRTGGSIITATDIAKPILPVGAKEAKEMVERKNEEDFMFDTLPEDYQPQQNQDPNLKKTLGELIADIAKTEKAKRKSQSKRVKHKPKSNGSPQDPEREARRISALSLKSVRDEIKLFESQALKQQREREQYQENFLVEEKAAVQARIQELMKYVAIREDYRPPKQPRDFVMENILKLQKMHPQKRIEEVKEQRKPNVRYPSTVENLYSNGVQQLPGKPMKIRRYRDSTGFYEKERLSRQQDHQQKNPKPQVEKADREKQECDICDLLTRVFKNPNSDLIQKTKAQKLRKKERA